MIGLLISILILAAVTFLVCWALLAILRWMKVPETPARVVVGIVLLIALLIAADMAFGWAGTGLYRGSGRSVTVHD